MFNGFYYHCTHKETLEVLDLEGDLHSPGVLCFFFYKFCHNRNTGGLTLQASIYQTPMLSQYCIPKTSRMF